mmetsp:Transcript_4385/g.10080  ORF Transcript_4385/g.10080 Transcript_4385/m.10080 type:complete len:106 (+) Transcript_4385:1044-1361(+)
MSHQQQMYLSEGKMTHPTPVHPSVTLTFLHHIKPLEHTNTAANRPTAHTHILYALKVPPKVPSRVDTADASERGPSPGRGLPPDRWLQIADTPSSNAASRSTTAP